MKSQYVSCGAYMKIQKLLNKQRYGNEKNLSEGNENIEDCSPSILNDVGSWRHFNGGGRCY